MPGRGISLCCRFLTSRAGRFFVLPNRLRGAQYVRKQNQTKGLNQHDCRRGSPCGAFAASFNVTILPPHSAVSTRARNHQWWKLYPITLGAARYASKFCNSPRNSTECESWILSVNCSKKREDVLINKPKLTSHNLERFGSTGTANTGASGKAVRLGQRGGGVGQEGSTPEEAGCGPGLRWYRVRKDNVLG